MNLSKSSTGLRSAGYGSNRIRIDPSVVRGLEYYTGPVFEVELTFPTADGSSRFGSVGGGGRYDGLVSRFRGEPVPATGFSIGVSRLAAALQHLGKLDGKPEPGPVVVTVFDQGPPRRLPEHGREIARRGHPRRTLSRQSGKFGAQMKYADKRNAPCVVIQGPTRRPKARSRSRTWSSAPTWRSWKRAARSICRSRRRPSSRSPRTNWSRRSARCWRATDFLNQHLGANILALNAAAAH